MFTELVFITDGGKHRTQKTLTNHWLHAPVLEKSLSPIFFFVLESQLHKNLQYMTTGLECMHIIKYECFSSLQLHWFACLWDKRENLRTSQPSFNTTNERWKTSHRFNEKKKKNILWNEWRWLMQSNLIQLHFQFFNSKNHKQTPEKEKRTLRKLGF